MSRVERGRGLRGVSPLRPHDDLIGAMRLPARTPHRGLLSAPGAVRVSHKGWTCSAPPCHNRQGLSHRSTPYESCYFKSRPRKRLAERFRVNALASRPGRSRFAACVRRLRQGVACAKVSRGGPARWRGRVPGRPSRACSRSVSPRIERPHAPKGLWFTVPEAEMHELISNRGASAKIRTARRARKAEVSGHESG